MIGDSLTWQMYNSLACLLAPVTAHGFSGLWEEANTTVTGDYGSRTWPEDRHILKQYWCLCCDSPQEALIGSILLSSIGHKRVCTGELH